MEDLESRFHVPDLQLNWYIPEEKSFDAISFLVESLFAPACNYLENVSQEELLSSMIFLFLIITAKTVKFAGWERCLIL